MLLMLGVAVVVPGAAFAEEPLAEKPQVNVDMSKGGITFGSGDNTLSIGARVQFRYTFDDRDQLDADLVGEGDGQEDGASGAFSVPRMRITFKGGMFKPWLKYEFQFELSNTSGDSSSKIKDAELEFETCEMAVIKVGQFKAPFSLQELTSSGRQEFVDRAITNAKFAPARDVGVMVTGVTEAKKFGYSVGVFNGAGESHAQDDQAYLYVGRVWFDPFGEYKLAESALEDVKEPILHVGLALRTGEAIRGTATPGVFEEPDNESAVALEFAYRQSFFFATAEYFLMSDEQANPASGNDLDSNGWHAQVGFMVIPKTLELGLRYAMIDPDEDTDDAGISEARLVFGYFWHGHNLKFQADIGEVEYKENYGSLSLLAARGLPLLGLRLVSGEELTDLQFRAQVQLAF
jgi:phosphate-selective porin